MSNLPEGTFIVGNKLYGVCSGCNRLVKLDKPIFGSFHFCNNDSAIFDKKNCGTNKEGIMEQEACKVRDNL